MAVPYIFANVTTTIPLSQLDNNFATAITLGNTAVYLGNTTTTLGNVTLSNVNVASGIANVSNLTATNTVTFSGTGAVQMTSGTTAQRPTPASGQLRFNTDTTQFEGYNGTTWSSVGGAAISNDTASATAQYPLFAHATSGTALTVYTSNANYLYTPSTGTLQAPAHFSSNGITLSNTTVSSSYTFPTGANGFSVGPMTIASGQAVTVGSGQRWLVL